MMAFVKILKKFDKVSAPISCSPLMVPYLIRATILMTDAIYFSVFQVTGKEVQQIYLKAVESSYYNSSDKVF